MPKRKAPSTGIIRTLDTINAALAPFVHPYHDDTDAPKSAFDRADRLIDGILYILSALLLIAMAAVVTYSIFMRYAVNRPPLWSEGVPMVFFIWMTFLALVVATRRGENIRVTYFVDKLPPRGRLLLELAMHFLVIAMMVVIFWYSFDLIRLQSRGTMLSTGWNLAVVWIPLPLAMALMVLYQFKRISWSVRTYRRAIAADNG